METGSNSPETLEEAIENDLSHLNRVRLNDNNRDKYTIEKEKNGSHPHSKIPSIAVRKSPGLKVSIPQPNTNITNLRSQSKPSRFQRQSSVSGSDKNRTRVGSCVISDTEFTINLDLDPSSGRRSAPIFSKRFVSSFAFRPKTLVPDASLNSYANEKRTQRKHGKRHSDVSRRRTKKYGTYPEDAKDNSNVRNSQACVGNDDTNTCRPPDYESEIDFSEYESDNQRDLQVEANKVYDTKAARQGYWSECDVEGQRHHHSYHVDNSYGLISDSNFQSGIDELIRNEDIDHDRKLKTQVFHTIQNPVPRHLPRRYQNQLKDNGGVPEPTRNARGGCRHSSVTSYGTIDRFEKVNVEEKSAGDNDDDCDDGKHENEKTPLFGQDVNSTQIEIASVKKSTEVKTEVYARRWYILFIFSAYCLVWSAVWSTWGPIAQSAKAVFDWEDADIAMFTWLGNIPFLVTMFPIAYLMDVKGECTQHVVRMSVTIFN